MLELVPGRRVRLTPYGAYYAVTDVPGDPARQMLQAILAEPQAELLTEATASRWAGDGTFRTALDMLRRLQQLKMVQACEQAPAVPEGPLEETLPALLAPLSGSGKALLADAQGFYLAAVGFRHESAEELAALSADLATLHTRHARLLANNLGIAGSSWGLLDPAGASQLGVWPLHLGAHRFALALAGRPRLNQEAFCLLVQVLARRYGASEPSPRPA